MGGVVGRRKGRQWWVVQDDKCRKGGWGYMMESLNVVCLPPLVTTGKYFTNAGRNEEGSLWP